MENFHSELHNLQKILMTVNKSHVYILDEVQSACNHSGPVPDLFKTCSINMASSMSLTWHLPALPGRWPRPPQRQQGHLEPKQTPQGDFRVTGDTGRDASELILMKVTANATPCLRNCCLYFFGSVPEVWLCQYRTWAVRRHAVRWEIEDNKTFPSY